MTRNWNNFKCKASFKKSSFKFFLTLKCIVFSPQLISLKVMNKISKYFKKLYKTIMYLEEICYSEFSVYENWTSVLYFNYFFEVGKFVFMWCTVMKYFPYFKFKF